MSRPLDERSKAGHPDVAAYQIVINEDGECVLVRGLANGDYAAIRVVQAGGLGSGRKIASKTGIAVVAGSTTDFEITTDGENGAGDALPADMEILYIIIQPHNGASPPVAISNRWRFTVYTHSAREVDDIFFRTDRTDRPASDDAFVVNAGWGYVNEEGKTEIPCSLYIEEGDTDATFTVKIIFA